MLVIFEPAVRLMDRLRVGPRYLVVGGAGGLLLAGLLSQFVLSTNASLSLTRQELGGAALIVPIRQLEYATHEHLIATSLISAETPYWLIGLIVFAYGTVVISWNGVSIAEFAALAPAGQVAAVAAVQTALAFSGAVIGPPIFGLIAAVADYRSAFLLVAACVLAAAVWQIVTSARLRRPRPS